MFPLIKKIKLIYVPFLIISIGFIGVYTFLHWFLFIYLNLFSIPELIDLYILAGASMITALVCVIIWSKTKFKKIDIDVKSLSKSTWKYVYSTILLMILLFPTMYAQSYVETASGKLTNLDHISQINQQTSTKYYSLKNYSIDKENIGVYKKQYISYSNAKWVHVENLNWNIYFVLPICENNVVITNNCPAWLGILYHNTIKNISSVSEQEKNQKWKEFVDASYKDVYDKKTQDFVYLQRANNDSFIEGYNKAIKDIKEIDSKSDPILLPVYSPFETRNNINLLLIVGYYFSIALFFLFILIISNFKRKTKGRFF